MVYRSTLSALAVLLLAICGAQDCIPLQYDPTSVSCGEVLPISIDSEENDHAMFLNGATAYMHCVSNDAFDLVDKDFSLSAWIRPESSEGRQNIISGASSTWASHGAYTLYVEDGLLRFTIRHMESSPWYRHLIGPAVPIGAWSHVVAVGDRALEEMRLYLNGELVGQLEWNGEMFKNTSLPLLVGVQYKEDWPGQYFAHFHGAIDDIGIWDSALEPSDISNMMTCPEFRPALGSLIAFWDMAEGDGQHTKDIGPNQYELIRLNSAAWVDYSPYGQSPFQAIWSTGDSTMNIAPQIVSDTIISLSLTDSQGFERQANIYVQPLAPTSELVSEEVCYGDSYTFPDGVVISNITQAISYEYRPAHDACGAPTIYMISPRDINTTITNTGDGLRADAIARSYVWSKCVDNAMLPVVMATSRTFRPSDPSAAYSVLISDGRCSAMSECIEWGITLLDNKRGDDPKGLFYPNPSRGALRWSSSEVTSISEIEIYDSLGQRVGYLERVDPQTEIQISQPGVYILRWIQKDGKTGHQKIRVLN